MKLLLVIFLLLVSSVAYSATVPALVFYNATGNQYTTANASTQFTSAALACQYVFTSSSHPAKKQTTLVGNICQLSYTTSTTISEFPIFTIYACPAPLVQVGSGTPNASTLCTVPTCPTGQIWNSQLNSCAADCNPKKGNKYAFSINGANVPSVVCLPDQCVGNVFYSSVACLGSGTSSCFGSGDAIYSGESCSGQTPVSSFTNPTNQQPPPDDSPQTKCVKAGQSFGTVNGVTVCVPKTSSGAAPITNTGTTSQETKETDENGNTTTSSSDTKSQSTLDNGQVITKTETTNSDGTKTESTVSQPASEFCASNPNHSICKKSDEETPSSCDDNPDLPQCFDRGEPEEGDPIGEQSKTVTFTPVAITSGGGCPADKSVSIAGRSITFSYSWLCQYASMFRPFMLAFAYLSAAMFLFWGYKGAQT
ncbi:MAG: hypothetical protein E6Q51_05030 [Methylophilus methylotrophus]|uniref:Uncharacterized protein n=1 Tax=Methylophilus methylotrophus TaxID=17 RepID=A0A5C7WJ16_METME|nr:MAG: hypothetical protein E6Q51_05030 [Methylophilus methylotrophus]